MEVEILVVDNRKGKGIFAKKYFPSGSVIFEEEPIVSCQFAWNEAYGYSACNHCMRPLEMAQENAQRLSGKWNLVLPYPQCCATDKSTIVSCPACAVKYCTENCRVLAFNKYHKNTCILTHERNLVHPLEKLEEAWKQLHFPPETSNIMLLARIIAMVQQSPNPQETFQMFLQFCHRTVNEDQNLAHKLVGEKFVGQIDLLLHIVSKAFSSEGVEPWFTSEGFQSLLALIGTNGQGVATSAISKWVKNCSDLVLGDEERKELDKFIDQLYLDLDKESGTFLDNEGSALYVMQSACNHSCTPNARPSFLNNNFKLSMIALKDIKVGEEILVSYLDECHLGRSRHTRQNILMENYLFRCDCVKCLSQCDDSDITSEDEMSEDEMSESD